MQPTEAPARAPSAICEICKFASCPAVPHPAMALNYSHLQEGRQRPPISGTHATGIFKTDVVYLYQVIVLSIPLGPCAILPSSTLVVLPLFAAVLHTDPAAGRCPLFLCTVRSCYVILFFSVLRPRSSPSPSSSPHRIHIPRSSALYLHRRPFLLPPTSANRPRLPPSHPCTSAAWAPSYPSRFPVSVPLGSRCLGMLFYHVLTFSPLSTLTVSGASRLI